MNRRSALQTMGAGAAALFAAHGLDAQEPHKVKGNIKQSVCRWCYGKVPLEQLAAEAAKLGYKSIELLGPDEFKTIKPFGLTCAMVRCKSITDGLNREANHDGIEAELRRHIDFAASEKIPNVICMAGNRKGLADDQGLAVCVKGYP